MANLDNGKKNDPEVVCSGRLRQACGWMKNPKNEADKEKGVAELKALMDEGYWPAKFYYAAHLSKQDKPPVREVKSLFKVCAEKGMVQAMFNLGVIALAEKKRDKAVDWLRKASDLGYQAAEKKLGEIKAPVQQILGGARSEFTVVKVSGFEEEEKPAQELPEETPENPAINQIAFDFE